MLPCDRFTMLKPKFSFRDHGEKFQCTLQMPGNSLITGLIKVKITKLSLGGQCRITSCLCYISIEIGRISLYLQPPWYMQLSYIFCCSVQ